MLVEMDRYLSVFSTTVLQTCLGMYMLIGLGLIMIINVLNYIMACNYNHYHKGLMPLKLFTSMHITKAV